MAALMARMERAETAIETLTRTVQALVGPERATATTPPKPEDPKKPEAEAEEEPEILPTFASEAPTSSETPPRCATPDPLDMLSPEQAMLASLLNVGALGGGGTTVVAPPQPATTTTTTTTTTSTNTTPARSDSRAWPTGHPERVRRHQGLDGDARQEWRLLSA